MENKKKRVVVRNAFDRTAVKTKMDKETLTKQEFKKECDINYLMSRYQETGTLPDVLNQQMGAFGDFTQIDDFKSAKDAVIHAEGMFKGLPAHIRKEFNEDPAALMEFMSNPDNLEKGIELGLFEDPKLKQERKESEDRKKAEQEALQKKQTEEQ